MKEQTNMGSGYPMGMAPGVGTKSFDKKPYVLAIVILSVLMIAGVSFGVVGMILGTQQAKNNAEVADNSSLADQLETVEIVDDAGEITELTVRDRDSISDDEKNVKAIVAEVKRAVEETGVNPAAVLTVYDMNAPVYRPEGFKVATGLDQSYGLYVTTESYSDNMKDEARALIMSEQVSNAIVETMRRNGFREYAEGSFMANQEYINDDGVVCTFAERSYPLEFGCAHTSWIDPEVAQFVKQVSDQSGYDGDYLYATKENVADSGQGSYQRLQASVGGAVGLFYRTSPDAPWQFFTGTQAGVECSRYNTDDLRKAFADTVCYDTTTGQESVVRP